MRSTGSKGRVNLACAAAATVVLASCAHPDTLRVGMTTAELDARYGKPSAERREGPDDVRIYTAQPLGQRASAAYVAPDGRVVKVDPLLNTAHFAQIKVGSWNQQEVFDHFGPPAEKRGTLRYHVWSYRYREAETWDSLFSIMFDDAGIVRQTQNGPDPMYSPEDHGVR